MSHLDLLKVSHVNAIVDGYEDTVGHLEAVYDAQLNMPIPGNPDDPDATDACLITIGDVIFELFAPRRRGERGQGRLLERYGDHFNGIEYQVPDVPAARARCEELDIRIINDLGSFFYTYPGACLGISWELWDGDWHERLGDHPDAPGQLHPAPYWRTEHPLRLDGLARMSVAVADLEAATARFAEVTGAPVLGRATRPQAVAEGAEFQVGDTVFELLAPNGEGPVSSFLERFGERIRSTVFRATDLGVVQKHLAGKGIDLVPGDREGTLAVVSEQNHNLLFEFTE